jgi:RNA polymerase-binding protein DksA
MNKSDLKHYKELLLKMRDRLADEINRIAETVLTDARPEGEHDQRVSETVDKEVVLETTEEGLRRAVSEALSRIDAGTYGSCADCGRNIPKQRLDALPYTPLCVTCEEKRERAAQ